MRAHFSLYLSNEFEFFLTDSQKKIDKKLEKEEDRNSNVQPPVLHEQARGMARFDLPFPL